MALENVSTTFIDKTDPSDHEKRENIELKHLRPWNLGFQTLFAINVQSLFFLLLALDHRVRNSFVFA